MLTGAIGASSDSETLLVGPNDRRFVSQGIQSTLNVREKTGPVEHRLEYGFRVHYDSIDRLHTQDGFSVQGTELIADNEPTETTANNSAQTIALSMYAIDAMSWGPLTVTAGARMESIRSEMDNRLTGVQDLTIQQVIVPGGGLFLLCRRILAFSQVLTKGFPRYRQDKTILFGLKKASITRLEFVIRLDVFVLKSLDSTMIIGTSRTFARFRRDASSIIWISNSMAALHEFSAWKRMRKASSKSKRASSSGAPFVYIHRCAVSHEFPIRGSNLW